MAQPELSREFVRKLIMQSLPTDADLEAFISDHFPEVHERCSLGMQRIQKVTLLLDSEPDRARILELLREERTKGAVRIGRAHSSLNPASVNRFLLYSAATLLVGLGAVLVLLFRQWAPAPVLTPPSILVVPPVIHPANPAKEPPPPPEPLPAFKLHNSGPAVINSSRVNIITNGKAK